MRDKVNILAGVVCTPNAPCPAPSGFTCPPGQLALNVLGTIRCLSWAQLDAGLQQLKWGGSYDHSNAELTAAENVIAGQAP